MAAFNFYIDGDPRKKVEFEVKRIINGGWAARNQEQLRKHIVLHNKKISHSYKLNVLDWFKGEVE